jgi:hypothetical protein
VATKTVPPEQPSGQFEPLLLIACLVLLMLTVYVTFIL